MSYEQPVHDGDISYTTHSAMQAAGVKTEEPIFVDYFGFSAEKDHFLLLPSGGIGKYFVTLKKMNDGAKARFQKATSKDLKVERTTGNAVMKVDPGAERHALLESSITGWNLERRSQKDQSVIESVPFNQANVRSFLASADPEVISDIEKAIRKMNPWMMDELSVEDIDKEIASLMEMREIAEKREAGKSDSAS